MTARRPIHRLPEGALRLARGALHSALAVEDHGVAMGMVVGRPVGDAGMPRPPAAGEGDSGVPDTGSQKLRPRAPPDQRAEQPMLDGDPNPRLSPPVVG